MKIGALHTPLRRQLINPFPYSPPTMNAAFLSEGMTMTHDALSHSSCGMSLSGTACISFSTVAASLIRSVPLVETGGAEAVPAMMTAAVNTAPIMIRIQFSPYYQGTKQEHYQLSYG